MILGVVPGNILVPKYFLDDLNRIASLKIYIWFM